MLYFPTMAQTSPDPIADPKGYQQLLLVLLGEDDPHEVQSHTPKKLRALIAEAGDQVPQRPAPREWSVLGCVAHLTDAEVMMSTRYRLILAHDEPELVGYDQDLWVDRLHSSDESAEALMALFEPLRAANLALWKRSDESQRARIGMHAERGPESYDLVFRMLAGHDRFHLAQAYRALAAVKGRLE
ncbi:MAG: DinB family protein [Acidimicrobiia bacterium]